MLQELRQGAARLLFSDYQAVKSAVDAPGRHLNSFSILTQAINHLGFADKLSQCGRLPFPRGPAFL